MGSYYACCFLLLISLTLCFGGTDTGKTAIELLQANSKLALKKAHAYRALQATTPAFSARYEGKFQEFRDAACFSGPLSIAVACSGGFELTGTSDPSITCEPLTAPLLAANTFFGLATDNGVRCTCGENCDVFVTADVADVDEVESGGSVFYTCSGDTVDSLYSRVVFEPTSGNGCDAAAASDQSHWHILQAGVLCNGAYTYDPFYFECLGYEAAFELGLGIPTEEFHCVAFGEGCGEGTACTSEFDSLYIGSDVRNLPAACIETTQPITPAPTPPIPMDSPFAYTTLFATSWGIRFISETSVCTSDTPSVLIECGRGSTIQRNETAVSSTTTTCTQPSESSLLCTDSRIGPASNTDFATVEYICTGPAIPTTEVQFQSTDSRCASDVDVEVASHILQLGVYCGIFDGYSFSDIYIECEEGGNFASLDKMGDIGDRYSCGNVGIFVPGSTSLETTVPAFSASTDNLWTTDAHSSCRTFGTSGSEATTDAPNAAPTTPETEAPAVADVTTQESLTSTPTTAPPLFVPLPTLTSAPAEPPIVPAVMANYKTEYTADFEHILVASCVGPPPTIQVMCTGDVRLVSTSRPSISCDSLPRALALSSHPNGLQCSIDCESAGDCDAFASDSINQLRFESIVFECSGDRLDDISGVVQVTQSRGAYTCPNVDDTPSQVHLARLGVSCGTDEQSAVLYDHDLFECLVLPERSFATPRENGFGAPGNDLFCFNIDSCSLNEDCDCSASGSECQIDLGVVGVVSDVYKFPEECIESLADITGPPSPSPVTIEESGVVSTSRFRTNWSLFTSDEIASLQCSVSPSVTVIECIRSDINLTETADSVTCNKEFDNILRCSDTSSGFAGDFTSFVEYECMGAGPGVPETEARLDPSTAQCDGNLREVTIGQSLQLAPYCDGIGFVFLDSFFVECGRGNLFFKPEQGEFRYSCVETASFEVDSSPSDPQDLAAAIIMTDRQWRDDFLESCVNFQKLDDSSPTMAPRPATTFMPINNGLTVMNSPTASPLNPSPRGIPSPATEEDRSSVGVIVGASVGAIVFLVLAGAVLFYFIIMKPERKESVKEVTEFPVGNDFSETGQSHTTAQQDGFVYRNPAPADYAQAEVLPQPVVVPHSSPVLDHQQIPAAAVAQTMNVSMEDQDSNTEEKRQYAYPRNSVPHSDTNVSFKDQAQSMIRPVSIGIPEDAHDDNTSGITEAETRQSADPSGIYSHEQLGGASSRGESIDP